jgi:hypothetical protein
VPAILRKEAVILAKHIARLHDITAYIPEDFQVFEPGAGHLWSVIVLNAGGVGAIIFLRFNRVFFLYHIIVAIIEGILALLSYCWIKRRSNEIRHTAAAQQLAKPDASSGSR